MLMILSKNILYLNLPRNKSRIYLHLFLLFHFAQVLVLESIWLGLKYTLFYVSVDHLVVTKVDVRLALMLTDVFQSFVTKESYKKNHKFDCDSKCIIYLFSCKACGLQYVGSTVERFRFRWNNYKNSQREKAQGVTPPQSFLHQHFLSEGHHGLVNDCEITLIDKTDSSDPTRRECFWIRLLKTYYPLGLNIEEELNCLFFRTN